MATDVTTVRHLTFGRPRAPRGTVPRDRLDAGDPTAAARPAGDGPRLGRISRAPPVRRHRKAHDGPPDEPEPDRRTFGLLDRHGYTRGDNKHVGRAILLLGDLARSYEGCQDHPFGPYTGEIPPRPEPVPSEPARRDAVTGPAGEVRTLISALIIAADYKRDRADCADQSCPTCEWRLQDAQAYDRVHGQLLQAAEATAAASHPEPARPQPGQLGAKPFGIYATSAMAATRCASIAPGGT